MHALRASCRLRAAELVGRQSASHHLLRGSHRGFLGVHSVFEFCFETHSLGPWEVTGICWVCFSFVTSGCGVWCAPCVCRYCIVPFLDVPVDNKIVEYILRCSFREGTLDFEVKDLVKVIVAALTRRLISCCQHACSLKSMRCACVQERPIDDMPSDDEDEAEQERKVALSLPLSKFISRLTVFCVLCLIVCIYTGAAEATAPARQVPHAAAPGPLGVGGAARGVGQYRHLRTSNTPPVRRVCLFLNGVVDAAVCCLWSLKVSDLAYLLRAMKKEVRGLQDAKLKKKAREALQLTTPATAARAGGGGSDDRSVDE